MNRPRRYPRGIGFYSYPTTSFAYFPYAGFYDDGFYGSDYFDPNDTQQPPNSGYSQPLDNDYADNSYPQPGPQDYPPYPQTQYPDTQYPQQPYPQAQYPQPEQPPAITPQMQYVPGSADTVTLIFKDGRPPEQIQNYLATTKTLTVINGSRHREIPIADLDIPATIKANRETGVGFQLPVSR